MITLEAVESFFPDRTVTVEERAAELGLNPAQEHMFRRIHGLDRMHYDPDLSLYDLVLPAARKILAQTDPRSVRYLIYCHALHGGRSVGPETAQNIKQLLGLENATTFALTQQNCAITLSAIDVAGALLQADGDPEARALVVTGDKPRHRAAQLVMNTCVVGDGSASALVAWNGSGTAVRSFVTRTRGEFSDGMMSSPALIRAESEMRPRLMLEVMREAADRADCTLDDIQVIIAPNPNTTLWQDTIKDEALRSKFFFDNIPRYSHCLASDVLINYVTLGEEKRFEPDRPAMFVAIGVGMTFSAMVFTPSSNTGGPRS
ncbi:3-oxoacyl-[acyl-carrier-protein] synthase III C-terminal domain-containing protein [Streptomyces sp. NPDC051636]|uniref:3-oxoacyl-[acyl-carrier-protein] synthase III C-terminal domain-containing protein n=1 Tax=Streptomyces sp. NPDC051636 TaxID=3365663 RepID=UPI0037BD32E3